MALPPATHSSRPTPFALLYTKTEAERTNSFSAVLRFMIVMSFSGRALYFNQLAVLLPSAPRRFNLNTIAFDGWKMEIKH
jgi:hypothetical protein